ncbi:MAG: alpha-L-fucosidase [Armatimonadetes bacterium]|nr:alpha-L-fucosidase [Armatimonadota bacterium]
MLALLTLMTTLHFEPTWESLQTGYKTPEWFRDAKFGIWAHWGPQCQPERGDWYAREMYLPGTRAYRDHKERYGPNSRTGFMDVIHEWHAERWDPDQLLGLYKAAGAQYFVALANHHDNFDLWNSKYQPWNSVRVGPKKDLIGGWAKAARKVGLRFGVSVHAAHAWSWYEPAQGADPDGLYQGMSYDGTWTKADGVGKWWEGLDPQDLYAQNHTPAPNFMDGGSIHARWNWGNGISRPTDAYIEKFVNRTNDLVDTYRPDLLYFDDTALPFSQISDAGLRIAAHYYNSNMAWHKGKNEAVLNGKILTPEQRKAMVWDIERGQSNIIEPLPWQTDTCIGSWHYDRAIYERHGYKSSKTVIQTLADVVSKNGNLLLSVPVRGDGSLDDQELKIVQEIGAWMKVNKEAIFGTRPWKVAGEGPAFDSAAPLKAQGFNEGSNKPFTAEDKRFTQKGKTLYVIVLGKPSGEVRISSLGKAKGLLEKPIRSVKMLGSKIKPTFTWNQDALIIQATGEGNEVATVFKLE